ncbi:MAG: hypothetical protein NT166_31895 [Candidatus Aminicenantes bacterium]|nr:hypothetical protein [Candidatus Aminicenantes bacterium]
MNKKVKTLILRCFVVLFVSCLCTQLSFAIIWQNWRECASAPGCSCTLTLQDTASTLKEYVLESAGYFLKSHAAYQDFLYCVEMSEISGIDSTNFKNTFYSAIDNMEKARAAYINLKLASEKMPYKQDMIDKLMKFDYDGFRIKNGLNEPIFEKLRAFLSKGDIAGFDTAVIANMDSILSRLYELKVAVDKGMVPEIALIWRTSQAYTEAQLFGQYMSEVFRDILF